MMSSYQFMYSSKVCFISAIVNFLRSSSLFSTRIGWSGEDRRGGGGAGGAKFASEPGWDQFEESHPESPWRDLRPRATVSTPTPPIVPPQASWTPWRGLGGREPSAGRAFRQNRLRLVPIHRTYLGTSSSGAHTITPIHRTYLGPPVRTLPIHRTYLDRSEDLYIKMNRTPRTIRVHP